jgi:hypothetical protein
MYAIKHKPTNLYTNLTFMGIDAVNIGINPKIYKEERLAKIDLDRIQEAFDRNKQSNYNGRTTFERNLKMLEEKNAVKKNATRTKNIEYYKRKLEEINKQEQLLESYVATDFEIVAI